MQWIRSVSSSISGDLPLSLKKAVPRLPEHVAKMANESMERAKNLLMGAIETALRITTTGENVDVTPRATPQGGVRSPLTPTAGSTRLTAYDEHKRLFGHSMGRSSPGEERLLNEDIPQSQLQNQQRSQKLAQHGKRKLCACVNATR